jgi:hypothetical protein
MTYYNDNLSSIRSSFGTASSSSSQVVPAEDTDVGNDQVMKKITMKLKIIKSQNPRDPSQIILHI